MARSPLFEAFDKTAQNFPSKIAIFFKQDKQLQNFTYQQLYQQVLRLGNLLRSKGLKTEDRVVILLGNQPEWPISFFAVHYNGAITVPIDINLNPRDIVQLIKHSQAKIVLTFEKLYSSFKQVHEEVRDLNILCVDSPVFLSELSASSSALIEDREILAEDKVAAMFYTSGTTNLPKGVLLSQGNLLSNQRSIQKLKIVTSEDVMISLLPLHHTYSFMVTCLVVLLEGAQVSYPASLNSEDLISCMQDTGVTIFVGVPQVFLLLHRAIKAKLKKMPFAARLILGALTEACWVMRKAFRINCNKLLFSKVQKSFGGRIKYMATGGARLDPQVIADFFKWGFTVLEGYGLTETSPVSTFNPPSKQKFGSVGIVIPEVEIKIINPDEKGIGEVAIKGPNVMLGYYQLPEDTARKLKEGWFYSGDLGYLDKDGYLYIGGRKDELIVLTSGKKVNPEEIESHYLSSPYIKEMCCFEAKVDGFLQQVKQLMAVVVPDEDYFRKQGQVNIEEKIKWELDNLSQGLSEYKRIKGFVISKEPLARTRLGKLMRHKVQATYFDKVGQVKKEEAVSSEEDVNLLAQKFNQKALSYIGERLKRKINLSDHLELDLGFDSLGRVELLLELKKYLNIQIPEEAMTEIFYANSIKELLLKLAPYSLKEGEGEAKNEPALCWPDILNRGLAQSLEGTIRLRPHFFDYLFTFLWLMIIKIIFSVFFLRKIKGRENLPKKGPCIIYANHTSYLDGFIIASSFSFGTLIKTYFLGFKEYFINPVLKNVVKTARLVPVDITFDLIKSMQVCSYLLKNSKILCLFPEGQRSPSEEVGAFKKGIGILAKELNVPLVPIYIEGAFRAWPRFHRFPRLAKIKVFCGRPVKWQDLANEYEALADKLRQELLKLKC